jgi:hypothetical protein
MGAVRPARGGDGPAAPTPSPYTGSGAPPPPQPLYQAPYGQIPAPTYGQYPPPGYAPYPQYAPYGAYAPPPPLRVAMVHRKRRGFLIGGAVTFGVSWLLSAVVSMTIVGGGACTHNCDAGGALWIPIAGPVYAAATTEEPGPVVLIGWTLVEVAGIALFAIGMAGHEVPEIQVARGGPTLRLTPLLARDAGGMALTARW